MSEYLSCGDCLSIMAQMPTGCIDLLVADLPYGITQNAWDEVIPFEPMWHEFRRICKEDAAILLFAAQPFASKLVCSNLADFRYDLQWKKNKATGFLNAKKQPLRVHEHILVFYRKPPFYAPQMTTGHKPGNYARRVQHSSNYGAQTPTEYGGSTERYPTSVLEIPIINNDDPDKLHPTQKPVDLLSWLIRSYSRPNAIVLDPTMGAGTTGVACGRENRHFIGIEKHIPYFEIARKRLAETKAA